MGFLDKARGKLGVVPSSKRELAKELLQEGVEEWRSMPAWKKALLKEELREGLKYGVARWRAIPAWKKERIKEHVKEKVDEFLKE